MLQWRPVPDLDRDFVWRRHYHICGPEAFGRGHFFFVCRGVEHSQENYEVFIDFALGFPNCRAAPDIILGIEAGNKDPEDSPFKIE